MSIIHWGFSYFGENTWNMNAEDSMYLLSCHKHGSVFRVDALQGYHQCHRANGFKPEECSRGQDNPAAERPMGVSVVSNVLYSVIPLLESGM